MSWKRDSEEAAALVGVWDMSGECRGIGEVCYGEEDRNTDKSAGLVVSTASSGSDPQDVGDRRVVVIIVAGRLS